MKSIVKCSIKFYQRFLSPYKGFRCAYGAYHGKSSCSAEILSIVDEEPMSNWLSKSKEQFKKCKAACVELNKAGKQVKKQSEKSDSCNPIDHCNPTCCLLTNCDCSL